MISKIPFNNKILMGFVLFFFSFPKEKSSFKEFFAYPK